MCGRYVLDAPEDLSERFQLRQMTISLPPSWNVAPTNQMPVIVESDPDQRQVKAMQWGLIPRWAKPGGKKAFAPINARGETLSEKPMFRGLIRNRRCLVPATGFYEWKNLGDHKQPYFISLPEDPLFAFGGLYDESVNEQGETIGTYTIITTEPNDLMRSLHDRMPLIVPRESEAEWLDPDVTDVDQVQRLIAPFAADAMEAVPVSRRVNNVRNNGPDLIDPLSEDERD